MKITKFLDKALFWVLMIGTWVLLFNKQSTAALIMFGVLGCYDLLLDIKYKDE